MITHSLSSLLPKFNQSKLFFRTAFSLRTSLTQPSMFSGLVLLESMAVPDVVNAGISLSTVLNVQVPFQLTVLCTWVAQSLRIPTVSAILRGTVITSTKAGFAWDSGSVIVPDMETLTPTQAGIQCPGSLLRKFISLRLRTNHTHIHHI